ncbi:MAG: hypothetical protein OXH06_18710 [Gemmatimonadetes bacterium]|nr:hypothetical protein [Gemmatimonadota bacterium]
MKPVLLGLLSICVVVACGGDDDENNPAASETLAGSYDLLRLTPSGGSAITPPNASGIMTLTENRYSIVASYVTAGSEDVIRVAQSGGYSRSGASLSLTPDGGGGARSGQVADGGSSITVLISVQAGGQTQNLTLVFSRSGG